MSLTTITRRPRACAARISASVGSNTKPCCFSASSSSATPGRPLGTRSGPAAARGRSLRSFTSRVRRQQVLAAARGVFGLGAQRRRDAMGLPQRRVLQREEDVGGLGDLAPDDGVEAVQRQDAHALWARASSRVGSRSAVISVMVNGPSLGRCDHCRQPCHARKGPITGPPTRLFTGLERERREGPAAGPPQG